MGMIAAVETERGLCPIRWVGRKGLSVKAQLYCGDEASVADGVVQVPDTVLKGAAVMSTNPRRGMIKLCEICKTALPGSEPVPPQIG